MIRPFIIAAAVLAGSPALAQEITTSRAVSYADLDLARPAGQATLLGRIGRAVQAVCGSRFDYGSAISADVAHCRKVARQAALAKMSQAVAVAERRRSMEVASVR